MKCRNDEVVGYPLQEYYSWEVSYSFAIVSKQTLSMLNKNLNPFPILKTDRLTLRQLMLSDAQEIFALRSDKEINKFLDRPESKTIDDARNFINKVNENIPKNNCPYWAITLNDSDKLIGTICLFGFSDENEKCEIGFELLTNYQGQGLMTEAVTKVIDYAFNTIKVKKIEAFTHKDNLGSIKLLEKLSFRNSTIQAINHDLIGYILIKS